MTTHPDDDQPAVAGPDHVAPAVDQLGRLAQMLTAGFGDKTSDTEHRP